MNEEKLKKGYSGYLLTEAGRAVLLSHVNPVFPDVISHHVTDEFGIYETLPDDATCVRAVAVAQNDTVQAVIVEINGTLRRTDGCYYHITLSLDKATGAKPVDSVALIKDSNNWTCIDAFNIAVTPAFFPF